MKRTSSPSPSCSTQRSTPLASMTPSPPCSAVECEKPSADGRRALGDRECPLAVHGLARSRAPSVKTASATVLLAARTSRGVAADPVELTGLVRDPDRPVPAVVLRVGVPPEPPRQLVDEVLAARGRRAATRRAPAVRISSRTSRSRMRRLLARGRHADPARDVVRDPREVDGAGIRVPVSPSRRDNRSPRSAPPQCSRMAFVATLSERTSASSTRSRSESRSTSSCLRMPPPATRAVRRREGAYLVQARLALRDEIEQRARQPDLDHRGRGKPLIRPQPALLAVVQPQRVVAEPAGEGRLEGRDALLEPEFRPRRERDVGWSCHQTAV